MTEAAAEAIARTLAAVAGRLGIAPDAVGSAMAWSRGGIIFAILVDATAEFRLDGPIAAAALRTPDTAPSERGADWVRFVPRAADRMALDRAEAWFEAAYRRAG